MKFEKNKTYHLLNNKNEIEDIDFVGYRDIETGWDTYTKTPIFKKEINNGLYIEILDNNDHGEIFDNIDLACMKRDFTFELKNQKKQILNKVNSQIEPLKDRVDELENVEILASEVEECRNSFEKFHKRYFQKDEIDPRASDILDSLMLGIDPASKEGDHTCVTVGRNAKGGVFEILGMDMEKSKGKFKNIKFENGVLKADCVLNDEYEKRVNGIFTDEEKSKINLSILGVSIIIFAVVFYGFTLLF